MQIYDAALQYFEVEKSPEDDEPVKLPIAEPTVFVEMVASFRDWNVRERHLPQDAPEEDGLQEDEDDLFSIPPVIDGDDLDEDENDEENGHDELGYVKENSGDNDAQSLPEREKNWRPQIGRRGVLEDSDSDSGL
jgi:hypothetical protein